MLVELLFYWSACLKAFQTFVSVQQPRIRRHQSGGNESLVWKQRCPHSAADEQVDWLEPHSTWAWKGRQIQTLKGLCRIHIRPSTYQVLRELESRSRESCEVGGEGGVVVVVEEPMGTAENYNSVYGERRGPQSPGTLTFQGHRRRRSHKSWHHRSRRRRVSRRMVWYCREVTGHIDWAVLGLAVSIWLWEEPVNVR